MTDVTEAVPGTASSPRPGWYQDPRSADSVRWWNGTGWTGDVRPKPVAAPAPVAPSPAPAAPAPAAPAAPAPVTHSAAPGAVPPIPVPPWATPGVNYGPSAHAVGPSPHAPAGPGVPVVPGAAGVAASGPWASPSTPAVWVLASIPLALGILGYLSGLGGAAAVGRSITGLLGLLGLLFSILAAARDRRQLRARGYTDLAHPAWVLLVCPVVYLAIRTAKLRKAGVRGAGPLILAAVTVGISMLISVAAVVLAAAVAASNYSGTGAMYGAFDRNGVPEAGRTPTSEDVASFIADSEYVLYRRDEVIDCGTAPLRPGSVISCTGHASSGSTETLAFSANVDAQLHVSYSPVQPAAGAGTATP